jgi:hypothetical protein
MWPTEIENHLIWWAKHNVQFCHVSFFACQVLGIVGSHIEINNFFNVVGVISNLKWYWLGIDNLDKFILIIKNWHSDACVGCDGPLKPKAMAKCLEKDYGMIEKHNKLIKEQNFFEALKKVQILISFYFTRSIFFFHPQYVFFC